MMKSKGIFRQFFRSLFSVTSLVISSLFIGGLIEIFSIITIREPHFESAFELFVENQAGFPMTNSVLGVPSVD